MENLSTALIFIFIVVAYVLSSIKILAEYERGVVFRLGKLLPEPKGPGLVFVFLPIDRMVRVSLRTVVAESSGSIWMLRSSGSSKSIRRASQLGWTYRG